jgi:hypothetical protein
MYKVQEKQFMVRTARVLYALSAIITVIAGAYIEITFSNVIDLPWKFAFAVFVTASASVQMTRVFAASERSLHGDYATDYSPE